MLSIRQLKGNDISVCAKILADSHPILGITERLFLKKVIFEDNFTPDGFFVAERDSKVCGFLNAVYRQIPIWAGVEPELTDGWFSVFCVADGEDVRAVGGALLDAGEAYLLSHGRTHISTGYFPTFFTQGVEASQTDLLELFRSRGYDEDASISMELDLNNYRESEIIETKRKAIAEKGYYVGPLQSRHIPSILNADSPFGNASWAYEFRTRIADGDLGALRVCSDGDKVIGVTGCHDPNAPDGRFGPFGVDPAYRNCGIGAVLIADALAEMKHRGDTVSWMQWVHEGGPAYSLYSRVGYRRRRQYYTFSKQF